jgi:hypothetical protein
MKNGTIEESISAVMECNNTDMKKWRTFLIVIFCLAAFIVGFCVVSYREFKHVNNPIMAGVGLVKLKILNEDYLIIQDNPKIIIAKSKDALDILEKYMHIKGFNIIDQLGSYIVFENNVSERQSLNFYVNKYYSIWVW